MRERLSTRAAMIKVSTAGQGGGSNCKTKPVLKASMSLLIDPAVSFPPINLRSYIDAIANYRTFSRPLFYRTVTIAIDRSGVVHVYNQRFSSTLALAGVRPASPQLSHLRMLSGGFRSAIISQILLALPFYLLRGPPTIFHACTF